MTVDAVAESVHRKVLVTTGTFLMADLARMIQHHKGVEVFNQLGGKVVLTGSLTPMQGYLLSDGGFNLGMSLAILQEQISQNVVLVMNGSCFDASDVVKDLTTSSFSSDSGTDLLQYDDLFVIPAGGSIDFAPDGLDQFVPASSSAIPSYLRHNVKMNRNFQASTLCVKDSRSMTNQDKERLADVVSSVDSNHILITLGIYRLKEIQDFLRKRIGEVITDKTVMLTGSRMPLRSVDMTDASFNLGYALGRMPFEGPGIHTSINGRICDEKTDPIFSAYTPQEIAILKRQKIVR